MLSRSINLQTDERDDSSMYIRRDISTNRTVGNVDVGRFVSKFDFRFDLYYNGKDKGFRLEWSSLVDILGMVFETPAFVDRHWMAEVQSKEFCDNYQIASGDIYPVLSKWSEELNSEPTSLFIIKCIGTPIVNSLNDLASRNSVEESTKDISTTSIISSSTMEFYLIFSLNGHLQHLCTKIKYPNPREFGQRIRITNNLHSNWERNRKFVKATNFGATYDFYRFLVCLELRTIGDSEDIKVYSKIADTIGTYFTYYSKPSCSIRTKYEMADVDDVKLLQSRQYTRSKRLVKLHGSPKRKKEGFFNFFNNFILSSKKKMEEEKGKEEDEKTKWITQLNKSIYF